MSTISVTVTVAGTEFRATRSTDNDRVDIDRRDDGSWVWLGRGRWSGPGGLIYDCDADLDSDIYDALDASLDAAHHMNRPGARPV